ncbi:thiamine-phosphate kinase [Prochlorococcus marinus]|uniref:Thiamine-monophosphate kinase n=1 Tax=Prochlorococcus marinus (strain MIT 9211) TaxID=93059 RepID=A9B9I0_PROM4|nr:thiamine-phosphate kinase [Prochlorococcus marinus]ABX07955.1 putative thiamine-monophosphate kinase [Prochlorococcus marinus str. MIT 9211]
MPESSGSSETLLEIGEREILNRLKKYMDDGQIDNDTALIKNCKKDLIINTDLMVEKVHFSSRTMTPEDIGWKAITSNFSDLASSGLDKVLSVTIGLIAPPSTSWSWVNRLYKGMTNALEVYGGKLIGGDISKGNEKVISITAIGSQGPLDLHRSHAIPGDCLVTSGPHGLSRLGLALLLEDKVLETKHVSDELKAIAIESHQHPSAPIKALKSLINCKPTKIPWRAAGTDSSDGLLEAIKSICISSNCKAIIRTNNLPTHKDWPKGNHWDKWCLNGGEDYELVISLPLEWANEWIKIMPLSKIIGDVKQGSPEILWENGKEIDSKNYLDFEHFQNK